jgi:hypothetical protein
VCRPIAVGSVVDVVGGAVAEQGAGGHDEMYLDRHPGGGGLPGDALHQDVGHQLPPGAAVAGGDRGVSRLAQRRVHGHTLGDRE